MLSKPSAGKRNLDKSASNQTYLTTSTYLNQYIRNRLTLATPHAPTPRGSR
jgi:hypothetical protein